MLSVADVGPGHMASEGIQAAVQLALEVLQEGGFVESFAITWGSTPNLPGPSAALPLRPEALGSELFQVRMANQSRMVHHHCIV